MIKDEIYVALMLMIWCLPSCVYDTGTEAKQTDLMKNIKYTGTEPYYPHLPLIILFYFISADIPTLWYKIWKEIVLNLGKRLIVLSIFYCFKHTENPNLTRTKDLQTAFWSTCVI